MWRRLYTRKGQSTGEYALIFAIVLGAIVAMQTYVKRGLQARVKEGADYMARGTKDLGLISHYDPYYFSSDYTTSRASSVQEDYADGAISTEVQKDLTIRAGYTEHSAAEEELN